MSKWIALVLALALTLGCPDDPFCRMCGPAGRCLSCFDAVLDSKGRCQAVLRPIEYCSIYKKIGGVVICSQCVFGYRSTGKACEECADRRCASCPEYPQVCRECFDGLLARNGECSEEKTGDANCLIARSDSECELCRPGFAVDVLRGCVPGPANCHVRIDDSTCGICLDGTFITQDSTCQGKPKPVPDFPYDGYAVIVLLGLMAASVIGVITYILVMKHREDNRYRFDGDSYGEPLS